MTRETCSVRHVLALGALLLAAAGPALADNSVVQVPVSVAAGHALVENRASIEMDGDGAQAASNCQLLVAVDVAVVNLAAADALGLIDDSDRVVAADYARGSGMRDAPAATSNAACAHRVGAVRLAVASAPGWGEAPPHVDPASSHVTADGYYARDTNTIIQVPIAVSVLGGAVDNSARVLLHGGGSHAVANCQLLVAVNVFVVNAALSEASAAIEDADDAVVASQPAVDEAGRDATAKCEQTIESLEVVLSRGTT